MWLGHVSHYVHQIAVGRLVVRIMDVAMRVRPVAVRQAPAWPEYAKYHAHQIVMGRFVEIMDVVALAAAVLRQPHAMSQGNVSVHQIAVGKLAEPMMVAEMYVPVAVDVVLPNVQESAME